MKHTIKSNSEIDEMFQSAKRFSTSYITLLIQPTRTERDRNGRVAFIVGKRLGNAVFRNSCKRKLRAAAQISGLPLCGYDIALVAKSPRVRTVAPVELAKGLSAALEGAGLS